MRSWLKNIRKQHNLTQADVAKECNISTNFYCCIETGERRPSPEVAKRIASNLNFDWTLFFQDMTA